MLDLAKNFVQTVWDPRRSDVRAGIDVLIARATRDASADRVARFAAHAPELAALYAERYDPPLDVAALAQLPAGTLGRAYARFVTDNGIVPLGDLVEAKATNLLAYAIRRAYKLHDILHVILGCDASALGEVRIVSFSIGQADREHAGAARLALAVLLLHLALRRPTAIPEARRLAATWRSLGERAAPYTALRLEDMMEMRLADVRRRVLDSM